MQNDHEAPKTRNDAPFRTAHVPTEDESYADGLKTGRTWKNSWRPGGPWVPSVGITYRKDPAWVEHCLKMQAAHDSWMRGFDAGLGSQKETPDA